MKRVGLTLACVAAMMFPLSSSAQAADMITDLEWQAYKSRFIKPDGRVIDDANGGISHSEGQGYGLLLAYLAGERADFELIWTFTRDGLLLRDDGLAVWKWDPSKSPPVQDPNNASDGDILIAYALALAGGAWDNDSFMRAATRLARAIAHTSIYPYKERHLLRPGISGFSAAQQPDGPVVNPSYWIFEAFPVLAKLAPEANWDRLSRDGVELVRDAGFGDRRLPPDWLSVTGDLQPAQAFEAEFGYNALRIPLYLMRARAGDKDLLRRLRDGMMGPKGGLALVDLDTGAVKSELTDPGYRIIAALASCVLDDQALPEDLQRFEPTVYYPSTLHLLALAYAREEHTQCLS